MIEPKVFIVIVNYNGLLDTLACIESIHKNKYKDYEIVIVDNKSTDTSCTQLNRNGYHYTYIEAKENNGFAAGSNIGIRYAMECGAEYIVLLNNDTLVSNDFLVELIKYQSSHKECDVAIGKIYYASEPKKIWYAGGATSPITTRTIHYRFGQYDEYSTDNIPKQVSFATGCYMSIRRNVIEQVGLLDEDYFMYDEDVDYSLRLSASNKKIFYVPTSIIYHKVSATVGNNSDLSQYYQVRNHFLLIKKNMKFPYAGIAKAYIILLLVKRMLRGELKPQNVFEGIKAFLEGEIKKGNRKGI